MVIKNQKWTFHLTEIPRSDNHRVWLTQRDVNKLHDVQRASAGTAHNLLVGMRAMAFYNTTWNRCCRPAEPDFRPQIDKEEYETKPVSWLNQCGCFVGTQLLPEARTKPLVERWCQGYVKFDTNRQCWFHVMTDASLTDAPEVKHTISD
eukprot:scaffold1762_cov383-Prasinococcus_capsulatus_cf.AAC.11